ncbi:MAG: histidine phosphatase family protein [Psychrosphaera sp.]|nr:histidine phosphatase family protein [Psychrosphaera sp.]
MSKILTLSLILITLLFGSFHVLAQSEIYLFRHAEKQKDGTKDPALTEQGHQRAKWLSHWFKNKKVTAIYSSDYQRTLQTVAIIAKTTGVEIQLYNPGKLEELIKLLKQKDGFYVVAGHSNTIPDTVQLLGGEPGKKIDDEEYDRLYQLTIKDGKVVTKRHKSSHHFKLSKKP